MFKSCYNMNDVRDFIYYHIDEESVIACITMDISSRSIPCKTSSRVLFTKDFDALDQFINIALVEDRVPSLLGSPARTSAHFIVANMHCIGPYSITLLIFYKTYHLPSSLK